MTCENRENMRKGLRLGDGMGVGKVLKRGTAREGYLRGLGVGRQTRRPCEVFCFDTDFKGDGKQ